MLKPAVILCGLCGALIATSCSHNPAELSSSFMTIDGAEWAYGDTIKLQSPNQSGITRLTVRHTDSYPYRNLWLEVSQRLLAADSTVSIVRDTLNIEMCDIYGQWNGSGFGDSYQLTVSLPHPLDTTTVNVRHIMRVDTIREITQLGIITSPE